MAYPDFTTSRAPDFVSNILRIPGMYNEMANANARTQIAQQQQATAKWMAQINAEKAAQEMQFAPAEEARKAALAANTIRATTADIHSKTYSDMLNETHASVAQKAYKDQLNNEQAVKEMNAELAKLAPHQYAGQEGLDLMNKYTERLTDPTISAKVYHQWGDTRQDYRNAQDRTRMDPEALDIYKEASDIQKLDEGQAMALARQKQAELISRQEAQRQVIIEEAKAAAKPDSLSASEAKIVEFYVGKLPRNTSANDLTPQQRSKATALFSNLVVEGRYRNGKVDESKVPLIWNEVLKGGDYKPQLDSLFPSK